MYTGTCLCPLDTVSLAQKLHQRDGFKGDTKILQYSFNPLPTTEASLASGAQNLPVFVWLATRGTKFSFKHLRSTCKRGLEEKTVTKAWLNQ